MAYAFSEQAAKRIEHLRSRYPTSQAALLPVLHLAQAEFGHLPDEVVELVSTTLDLPVAHVYGVVTFYVMYHRHPVGENVLMVCTNVSCMLRGGYEVLSRIEKQLGVKAGETTADGKFTVLEEECLAACADAPAVICGKRYFYRLDEAGKVEQMLEELRAHPERDH